MYNNYVDSLVCFELVNSGERTSDEDMARCWLKAGKEVVAIVKEKEKIYATKTIRKVEPTGTDSKFYILTEDKKRYFVRSKERKNRYIKVDFFVLVDKSEKIISKEKMQELVKRGEKVYAVYHQTPGCTVKTSYIVEADESSFKTDKGMVYFVK